MNQVRYTIQIAPGTQIVGRYVVRRQLGAGSYGVVYEAEQLSTGQSVAIKMLRPQPAEAPERRDELLARFHREIRLMGQLHHPNSIRLLDSGVTDEGARFVVLEYLQGQDLSEILKAHGALEPRTVHRIITAVLEALAEAHEQGVVHRDIKPANIMLVGSLKRPAVKVLDFGIATIQEGFRNDSFEQLTMAGQTRGTPAYMAPEQLSKNQVGPHTDLYATGLVLLECLMGRRAVTGANAVEVCLKQLDHDIDFPDAVRRGPFGRIIARAIACDPAQRYASADEMLSDLEGIEISGLVELAALEHGDVLPDGTPTQAMPAIPEPPPAHHDDAAATDPQPRTLALEAAAAERVVDDGVRTEMLPRIENPGLERMRGLSSAQVDRHVASTAPLPSVARAPSAGRTPPGGTPALVRPRRSRALVATLVALIVLTLGVALAGALWVYG